MRAPPLPPCADTSRAGPDASYAFVCPRRYDTRLTEDGVRGAAAAARITKSLQPQPEVRTTLKAPRLPVTMSLPARRQLCGSLRAQAWHAGKQMPRCVHRVAALAPAYGSRPVDGGQACPLLPRFRPCVPAAAGGFATDTGPPDGGPRLAAPPWSRAGGASGQGACVAVVGRGPGAGPSGARLRAPVGAAGGAGPAVGAAPSLAGGVHLQCEPTARHPPAAMSEMRGTHLEGALVFVWYRTSERPCAGGDVRYTCCLLGFVWPGTRSTTCPTSGGGTAAATTPPPSSWSLKVRVAARTGLTTVFVRNVHTFCLFIRPTVLLLSALCALRCPFFIRATATWGSLRQ